MEQAADIVCFLHGKESGPWGIKIQQMAEVAKAKGFLVESPDHLGIDNPDERVDRLRLLPERAAGTFVLVGSSMGGYVATVASQFLNPSGLFLLAPAFLIAQFTHRALVPHARAITIVHGWQDEVIPVHDSIKFAQEYRAALHLIDGDHRLIEQIPTINAIFSHFLDRLRAR
jgi:alpha/beta superfamily hydrolase